VITRPRVLVVVAIVAASLIIMAYQVNARRSTPLSPRSSAPPQQINSDLRNVMQSRVHEEYTHLSFTNWHDRPLTSEKMDAIAASSGRIMEVAKGLDTYEAVYRQQGWTDDDVKFFEEKRLQLSRVAEELNRAAQKHDAPQVVNFFMHLDNTCQSCHKRFRPDLSWT
jgi:cytochrome c556